jgi:hypothetical protein
VKGRRWRTGDWRCATGFGIELGASLPAINPSAVAQWTDARGWAPGLPSGRMIRSVAAAPYPADWPMGSQDVILRGCGSDLPSFFVSRNGSCLLIEWWSDVCVWPRHQTHRWGILRDDIFQLDRTGDLLGILYGLAWPNNALRTRSVRMCLSTASFRRDILLPYSSWTACTSGFVARTPVLPSQIHLVLPVPSRLTFSLFLPSVLPRWSSL